MYELYLALLVERKSGFPRVHYGPHILLIDILAKSVAGTMMKLWRLWALFTEFEELPAI